MRQKNIEEQLYFDLFGKKPPKNPKHQTTQKTSFWTNGYSVKLKLKDT
jgi:hypothetical protein